MISQGGSPVYSQVSSDGITETPMSRTHQYRKVMKPLLERKRRARINACLDELKDLMVYALQAEGESISKLEKADVMELTVKHLRKLKRQQMLATNPGLEVDRYQAGYNACATEVGRCMRTVPGMNPVVTSRLMSHLNQRLTMYKHSKMQQLPVTSPLSLQSPAHAEVKPAAYLSPHSDSDLGYVSGRDSTPSPNQPQDLSLSSQVKIECQVPAGTLQQQVSAVTVQQQVEQVWRPF